MEKGLRVCGFPLSPGSSPSRADCVVAMIRSAPSGDCSANSALREREEEEGDGKREREGRGREGDGKGERKEEGREWGRKRGRREEGGDGEVEREEEGREWGRERGGGRGQTRRRENKYHLNHNSHKRYQVWCVYQDFWGRFGDGWQDIDTLSWEVSLCPRPLTLPKAPPRLHHILAILILQPNQVSFVETQKC